ncbi:MAG: hypothetical protein R3F19_22065 [Verrucomicrobiales bacterium]
MITLELTEQDLNIAEAQDDPAVSVKVHKKLLAVSMHYEGVRHEIICGVCVSVPPHWPLISSPIATVDSPRVGKRYYQPASSLAPFWQCLICSFKAAPAASAKDAVRRITNLTGITLSESQG